LVEIKRGIKDKKPVSRVYPKDLSYMDTINLEEWDEEDLKLFSLANGKEKGLCLKFKDGQIYTNADTTRLRGGIRHCRLVSDRIPRAEKKEVRTMQSAK